MTSPPPTEDAILFRPSKKRKIYRQRAANDEDAVEAQAPQPSSPNVVETSNAVQSLDELIASASGMAAPMSDEEGQGVEGIAVSMSEILRLRRKNKRVGGVEFRATAKLRGDGSEETGEMVALQEGGLDVVGGGIPRNFAPPTGVVGDVNKHMMAYIDSELAKRRPESTALSMTGRLEPATSQADNVAPGMGPAKRGDPTLTRQPATIGKLQEIDLGDEARSLNIQRTQKAQRQLNGEVVEDEGQVKPVKIRLGPDGKPWRGRKKRGSEDIARDQAVEAVFRENRLEIYEPPAPTITTGDTNGDSDDRLAEAFRKEFMDAVSQRQRKKPAQVQAPARTAQGKKEEEVMKGPKLGGSRNARASMRESMLKAAGVLK